MISNWMNKNNQKKQIAILGSTGSIGVQTLQVIEEHQDLFAPYVLTANNSVDVLIKQALLFHPVAVVIANENKLLKLKDALAHTDIRVYGGDKAIADIVQEEAIDIVVTAMVGYAGLLPTIKAIEANKTIALANKETLVVAGELVTTLARRHQVAILPVDSEHSAIFQCLVGEPKEAVEKLILTASGGPFRNFTLDMLQKVTPSQALNHPNWDMGAKITIDSASMINKGFEVIEAKWLFGMEADQIDVVVHPQSVIHSMVQYRDSSIKAQMGVPDMRLPIQYALTYPNRISSGLERLDFFKYNTLTFEKPDPIRFRNLALAFQAIKKKGNMPCILNAANEVVVAAFLAEKISFLKMSDIIAQCMDTIPYIKMPTYEDYVSTDAETRCRASELIIK
ncbi:MAG: 1-deoxy-D-xylulose-5-phosphate reductoisomerase [Bacteroidaceae bacterium]